MMNRIADLFKGKKANADDQIHLTLGNVVLPLDLVLQMIIRQQNQLFTENTNLRGRFDVQDSINEQMEQLVQHVHEDSIQLRQTLEGASKHPVERVDEQTEEKEQKTKRNLVN